jgi:hypothetical protein
MPCVRIFNGKNSSIHGRFQAFMLQDYRQYWSLPVKYLLNVARTDPGLDPGDLRRMFSVRPRVLRYALRVCSSSFLIVRMRVRKLARIKFVQRLLRGFSYVVVLVLKEAKQYLL